MPTLTGDLELFGFTQQDLDGRLATCPTLEAAQTALKGLKRDIKKKYRQLVKEHHPDVGGETDQFLEVRDAFERLMNLEIRPQQPVVQVVRIFGSGFTSTNSTFTSSTINSSWW